MEVRHKLYIISISFFIEHIIIDILFRGPYYISILNVGFFALISYHYYKTMDDINKLRDHLFICNVFLAFTRTFFIIYEGRNISLIVITTILRLFLIARILKRIVSIDDYIHELKLSITIIIDIIDIYLSINQKYLIGFFYLFCSLFYSLILPVVQYPNKKKIKSRIVLWIIAKIFNIIMLIYHIMYSEYNYITLIFIAKEALYCTRFLIYILSRINAGRVEIRYTDIM